VINEDIRTIILSILRVYLPIREGVVKFYTSRGQKNPFEEEDLIDTSDFPTCVLNCWIGSYRSGLKILESPTSTFPVSKLHSSPKAISFEKMLLNAKLQYYSGQYAKAKEACGELSSITRKELKMAPGSTSPPFVFSHIF